METSPTGPSAPEPERGETPIGIAVTGTGGGLLAQGCPSRRLLPEAVVGDDEERLPLPEGGSVGLCGGSCLPPLPRASANLKPFLFLWPAALWTHAPLPPAL